MWNSDAWFTICLSWDWNRKHSAVSEVWFPVESQECQHKWNGDGFCSMSILIELLQRETVLRIRSRIEYNVHVEFLAGRCVVEAT